MRRGGFTLIEVMMGVVLASVVALLAFGAVSTAADTRERLAQGRDDSLAEAAWRSFVTDAVRGTRAPLDYGQPTLVLRDGIGLDGLPADELRIVTGDGAPPLSPGSDWAVSFGVEDDRVVARAQPLGPWSDSRFVAGPDGIRGMSVQALGARGWVDAWASDVESPRALRIVLWGEQGPTGVPLVIALPTEAG